MPISAEQFVKYYPRLYHMAEANIWPSIRKHGLLSTTELLDLFEVNGKERRAIEEVHRPDSVTIRHEKHGTAVIRDQKPMREGALQKCLRGMSAQQWYKLLNGQVFFWVTAERVETLLNARAYRDHAHTVITVETGGLVSKYADRIFLSPINSGSTIYNPRERGCDTFRRFSDYPFEQRRALRGIANAVAECAVLRGVPDLRDFVMRVEHRQGSRTLEVLHPKP
jgi:hypothetical protein